jgi:transposase
MRAILSSSDCAILNLAPPQNAVVLCVDVKSQIQALNRTQKVLPMQPGHAEQRTHDYVRHGTTTLFAALEVATGRVTGLCKNRHRHQEFLAFLRHVARAYPDQQLHLVMDNYAAHKRSVKAWLKANPRIQVHFTPTSASWLNLVEVWFGIIERQAIRRGVFPSVRDLMIKIRACSSRLAMPADHDQSAFQGIHALSPLILVDEACGVPKSIFDAVDALATNSNARLLAIGNPDDPASNFAQICTPGSGWHVITVSALDTPAYTGEKVPEELLPLLVSPDG